jgi:hypothetical protein
MKRSLALALLIAGCHSSQPFEGLAPAQPTSGPRVLFDLTRRPLPEIPFPSDLATRPDASSPTGLRVNASVIAPSRLESGVRGLLDTLDGFGTFAPITVAFDRDLDVLDLFNRQNNQDPDDDAVYLVDLQSGQTQPLDFNGGHFPYELSNSNQYFSNDPLASVTNLLFPTTGPQPNFLHPLDPSYPATHGGIAQQSDDLLTFYERATRTLIMRPVLPLLQEHKYAVVLTARLRGLDGTPVGAPSGSSGINHAAQTNELKPLLQLLPGKLALSEVAYAWAFTTQSTTRDLESIRRGLHGYGPLAQLQRLYPVQTLTGGTTSLPDYQSLINVLQLKGPPPDPDPAKASSDPTLFTLKVADLLPLLQNPQIKNLLLGTNDQNVQALLDTYQYVDYFVMGQYISPSFLDLPCADGTTSCTQQSPPADQSFQIDYTTGVARTAPGVVTFMLAVPKARPEVGHVAPFPVVIAGHGYKSTRIEHILGFSGTLAKFGLATISIDAYGHGLGIDPTLEQTGRGLAAQYGLGNFADAVFQGRARDLNNDGVKESGGDFWTADTFHTRDVVRQSIVDWMQLVRVLRSFDGHGTMAVGKLRVLAGDFNNDGIPDVGGPVNWPLDVGTATTKVVFPANSFNPGSDTFAFGISLGGILTAVLPAVEPAIIAAAPTSTAGGLGDVGIRSTLGDVVQAVFLELFGPMFVNCHFDPNAGPQDPQTFFNVGACVGGAPDTLVMTVQDVNKRRDVPVAKLVLQPGDRVVVKNLAELAPGADCSDGVTKVDGCSTVLADANGLLRLPIAADWPTLSATTRPTSDPAIAPRVTVQVTRPGDPLQVTVISASGVRTIQTFELPDRTPQLAAAHFFGVDYKSGTKLTAVARGFGYSRNTPEFRRLMGLSQTILEPGDPVNYAPHYFNDPLFNGDPADPSVRRAPANVLVIGTSGDPGVPINTAIALARAAGLVELNKPDPDYGIPIDQVLIKSGAVEGVAKLSRYASDSYGPRAALGSHLRCDPGSDCLSPGLVDTTGYSCDAAGSNCTDGFNAPRLDPPLRQQLERISSAAAPCPPGSPLVAAGGCYSSGASACQTDGAGNASPGVSALLIPYMNRQGQHGFFTPQPGKAFDMDSYLANLIGRYFECRGRELHFDPCQTQLSSASPGGCPWIPAPPQ